MAATVAAIAVKQQSTESNVNTDVRFDMSSHCGTLHCREYCKEDCFHKEFEVNFEILIGGQVILEEHAECNVLSVGRRTSHLQLLHCLSARSGRLSV